MATKVGLILGTGAERTATELGTTAHAVSTPYGARTVFPATRLGTDLILLARHGIDHSELPHRLNHRANIAALRIAGVSVVFATNACGALRRDLAPGTLVAPHDLIDISRVHTTFWDADTVDDAAHAHNDFTMPYCRTVRKALQASAARTGIPLISGGVYMSVDGRRFETAAEVRLYAAWGADLIGMTGGPEAVLAREAGLCYAPLAIVTNLGAGLTHGHVSHADVVQVGEAATASAVRLLLAATALIDTDTCSCPAVVPPPLLATD